MSRRFGPAFVRERATKAGPKWLVQMGVVFLTALRIHPMQERGHPERSDQNQHQRRDAHSDAPMSLLTSDIQNENSRGTEAGSKDLSSVAEIPQRRCVAIAKILNAEMLAGMRSHSGRAGR